MQPSSLISLCRRSILHRSQITHLLVDRYFHHPSETTRAHLRPVPIPPRSPSQPQTSFLSADLPLLDVPYKRDGTVCGLSCLLLSRVMVSTHREHAGCPSLLTRVALYGREHTVLVSVGLLRIMAPRTFVCKALHGHMTSFISGRYLALKLLGPMVNVCVTLGFIRKTRMLVWMTTVCLSLVLGLRPCSWLPAPRALGPQEQWCIFATGFGLLSSVPDMVAEPEGEAGVLFLKTSPSAPQPCLC